MLKFTNDNGCLYSFLFKIKNITKTRLKTLIPIESRRFTDSSQKENDFKIPKFNDETHWIKPNVSEYFQIRRRQRAESDQFMNDCFLRAIEIRFRNHIQKTEYKTKNLDGKTDPEAQFYRRHFFGDDEIGDKKTIFEEKTLELPILGMYDFDIPYKTMRQLNLLLPYLGLRRFCSLLIIHYQNYIHF